MRIRRVAWRKTDQYVGTGLCERYQSPEPHPHLVRPFLATVSADACGDYLVVSCGRARKERKRHAAAAGVAFDHDTGADTVTEQPFWAVVVVLVPAGVGLYRNFELYIDVRHGLVVVVVHRRAQSCCDLTRLDLGEIAGRGRVGVVRKLDHKGATRHVAGAGACRDEGFITNCIGAPENRRRGKVTFRGGVVVKETFGRFSGEGGGRPADSRSQPAIERAGRGETHRLVSDGFHPSCALLYTMCPEYRKSGLVCTT